MQQPIEKVAAVLVAPPRGRDPLWPDRQGQLWVRSLRHAERRVAEAITALQAQPSAIVRACARVDWTDIGATLNVALSDEQQAAVQMVLQHPVAVLTGGPGTGKSTIVRAVLAGLGAAGIDLQALVPETFPHTLDVGTTAATVARFISGDGSDANGYVFRHSRLRELFTEQLLNADEHASLQDRFVAYGQNWYMRAAADWRLAMVNWPLPAYLRQFWITHLAAAGQWALIRQVLTESVRADNHFQQPWLEVRFTAEGSYAGYLADLDYLWSHAEQQGDLVLTLRCALIAATIGSFTSNLTASLVRGLVTIGTPMGRWTPTTALDTDSQMPDSGHRSLALATLVDEHLDLPWTWVLEVVRSFDNEYQRAKALEHVVPHLPPALVAEALTIAHTIEDDRRRIMALCQIVACLLDGVHLEVISEVRALIRTLRDNLDRAKTLALFATHLPSDERLGMLAEACAAAQLLETDNWRAEALEHLAPRLTPTLLRKALTTARALEDTYQRCRALGAIIPHLLGAEQPEVVAEALAALDTIPVPYQHVWTLKRLAPFLSPIQRSEALASARAIADGQWKALALVHLAPYLPPSLLSEIVATARSMGTSERQSNTLAQIASYLPMVEQTGIVAEALAANRAIRDDEKQVVALGQIIKQLPFDKQPKVFALTLAFGYSPWNEYQRVTMLAQITPHLSPALLAEVLAFVRTLRQDYLQVSALGQLAPHLPPALLVEALTTARAIKEEYYRVDALTKLVRCMPVVERPGLLAEAIAVARAISADHGRALALGQLAPHLSLALLTEALAAVCSLPADYQRDEAMKRLASYLPSEPPVEMVIAARALTNDYLRANTLAWLVPRLLLQL